MGLASSRSSSLVRLYLIGAAVNPGDKAEETAAKGTHTIVTIVLNIPTPVRTGGILKVLLGTLGYF